MINAFKLLALVFSFALLILQLTGCGGANSPSSSSAVVAPVVPAIKQVFTLTELNNDESLSGSPDKTIIVPSLAALRANDIADRLTTLDDDTSFAYSIPTSQTFTFKFKSAKSAPFLQISTHYLIAFDKDDNYVFHVSSNSQNATTQVSVPAGQFQFQMAHFRPLSQNLESSVLYLHPSNEANTLLISSNICTGCDLTNLNFGAEDSLSLAGTSFNGANLQGANFGSTTLNGVDFTDANLSSASFSEATLSNVNFTRANLSSSIFNTITFVGTSFQFANLSLSSFPDSLASSVDFSGANLQGANLAGVNLRYTSFQDATLQNTTLDNADLSGANLRRAFFGSNSTTDTFFRNTIWVDGSYCGATSQGGCSNPSIIAPITPLVLPDFGE